MGFSILLKDKNDAFPLSVPLLFPLFSLLSSLLPTHPPLPRLPPVTGIILLHAGSCVPMATRSVRLLGQQQYHHPKMSNADQASGTLNEQEGKSVPVLSGVTGSYVLTTHLTVQNLPLGHTLSTLPYPRPPYQTLPYPMVGNFFGYPLPRCSKKICTST